MSIEQVHVLEFNRLSIMKCADTRWTFRFLSEFSIIAAHSACATQLLVENGPRENIPRRSTSSLNDWHIGIGSFPFTRCHRNKVRGKK
jgi:hypothetical protein